MLKLALPSTTGHKLTKISRAANGKQQLNFVCKKGST